MYYINFCNGFYVATEFGSFACRTNDCRYATPFESFIEADNFAKEIVKQYSPRYQYFAILRAAFN